MAQDSSSSAAGSSAIQVFIYWAIVAVPLGWGVYKTVDKSKALFQGNNVNVKASSSPAAMGTPSASAVPAVVPTAASSATPVPAPAASPFSTAQPSATVAPIDTPAVPKT